PMSRMPGRLVAVIALIVALFPMDASADFVAKNVTAIFQNVSTENAFDFFLRVDGQIRSSNINMTINPVSNKFNNFQIFTTTVANDSVRFTNGMVNAGDSHTVVYRVLYDDAVRTGLAISSRFSRMDGSVIEDSSKQLALDAGAIFRGGLASLM